MAQRAPDAVPHVLGVVPAGRRRLSAPGTKHDYAVVFRQTFGGLLSSDGVVTVSVVGSKAHGWRIVYVSSSLAPSSALHGKAKLSPIAAFVRAARATGHPLSLADVTKDGKAATGAQRLIATGFMGDQSVKPVAFGTAKGAVRAYRASVVQSTDANQSAYDVIVDATTGKLLSRQNIVFNATDDPTWLAPEHSQSYNNMNAYPWNYPTTDNRVAPLLDRSRRLRQGREREPGDDGHPPGVASKMPWDVQATVTGLPRARQRPGQQRRRCPPLVGGHTFGNPALSATTSATRDYQPAFTDAWYTSGCNPANLTRGTTGNDIEASTVDLFVGHNVMHDWAYYLGFDEGHWNAQQYNNGVTVNDPTPPPGGPTIAAPLGNDGLIGNAQSGALTGSRDNANMSTGADGQHPTTNLFLWQSLAGSFYAPCVDGDYDFSVFGHEFGHLIENRMIGKGVGARQGTPPARWARRSATSTRSST